MTASSRYVLLDNHWYSPKKMSVQIVLTSAALSIANEKTNTTNYIAVCRN